MLTCASFSDDSSLTYPSSEQNLKDRFEQLNENQEVAVKFDLADRVVNLVRARMIPGC